MASIRGSRGIAVLFFTLVIALFAYFIYFLAVGNTDPAYYWQQNANRKPAASTAKAVTGTPSQRLLLMRNKPQTIGKLRLTYLGIADKHLIFDVNIMDLDPNFAYRYTIPLARSKKRFRIAETYFQAQATSRSKVRLVQIELK